MPKLPHGQGVCKDQCHLTAVIGVFGLLNSKHDAMMHLAPALQIYKFCIFELTNKATLVCY